MKPISKAGQWARGVIYVIIAALGALIADESFRSAMQPLTISYIGAGVAGLVALRAYLDQSTDMQSDTPQSVTIKGQSEPVKTREVSTLESEG